MTGTPEGANRVVFTNAARGDMRRELSNRSALAVELGISQEWATVDQVHGGEVVKVEEPGSAGRADALWTDVPDLPVAIFTADCLAVALVGPDSVGLAHAGWRGAEKGIVSNLRREMTEAGHRLERAMIGPGIGPCCFEVGEEVAQRFTADRASTTWGTTSVDLRRRVGRDLEGLRVWSMTDCTRHDQGYFSHRADATDSRLAAVAWI